MPGFGRRNNKTQSSVLNEYSDIRRNIKNGVLKVPSNYKVIRDWALTDCNKLQKVIIGENVTTIGAYAFSGCRELKEVHIPNSIEFIGQYCFVDCKKVEKFVTPINKRVRIDRLFSETIEKLNWIYKVKGDDRFVFSFSKPTEENVENIINLNDFKSVFKYYRFEAVCDDLFSAENFDDIAKLVKNLKKYNLDVHGGFFDEIVGTYKFKHFADADFAYFKNEFADLLKQVDRMLSDDRNDFYKFAMAFGCFSNKKIIDKNGVETDVLLSHKACSLLSSLIKKGDLTFANIGRICVSEFVDYPNPSQSFLKFISEQGPNKSYPNLEMLLKLEKKCPGIFSHIMTEFDKARKSRYYVDKKGATAKRPWEEAIVAFYKQNRYLNINDENKHIADRFSEFSLDQEAFDKASRLFAFAKEKRIPHHILRKEVKEETILDAVERIKKETQNEIAKGRQLIEDLYNKQFTFEMLDKHDPDNAIIGLMCSCCAHVTSELYGGNIAKATIMAPDVQNLVVRDNKGEIIAKGAMYVNQKFGYAVINDFEINEKYKKDETLSDGYYRNDDYTKSASKHRKLIFDALIRGIKAFAKEYDTEHPNNPLKKVNVGWGYNRLKKLCEQYEKETEKLHVPAQYEFLDATEEQYILYERDRDMPKKDLNLEKKL